MRRKSNSTPASSETLVRNIRRVRAARQVGSRPLINASSFPGFGPPCASNNSAPPESFTPPKGAKASLTSCWTAPRFDRTVA